MHDEIHMRRCLELAQLAAGNTAPNPMVGAMLVHPRQGILAEGWHRQWGGVHAEVDCLGNVPSPYKSLVPECTMYVTLEPCAHQGKTPSCASRIVAEGVKSVVIAHEDPFPLVAGKGLAILQSAGVNVTVGVLNKQAAWQNRRFFSFHRNKRPYVVLKWAESSMGHIAPAHRGRQQLSNSASVQLVHKWRTEESAIMVGFNTAINDNPQLTARHWEGRQPLRIVTDRKLQLPPDCHLLDGSVNTWIVNESKEERHGNLRWRKLPDLPALMEALFEADKLSVMVEGGGALLQSFIDAGLWDEARVIRTSADIADGIPAPRLQDGVLIIESAATGDLLQTFVRSAAPIDYSPVTGL